MRDSIRVAWLRPKSGSPARATIRPSPSRPSTIGCGNDSRRPPASARRRVVGVVGDTKQFIGAPVTPTAYVPSAQTPAGLTRIFNSWFPIHVVVRTAGDPAVLKQFVVRTIRATDARVPLGRVRTMEEILSASLAFHRFLMLLLVAFAGLAVALAAVGIYGVMSYLVTQSTREIGVRIALGAQPRRVFGVVTRHGMLLAGLGAIVGVAGSLALTRLLRDLRYALRTLRRSPGFTTVAVLTLAIGIGANTGIFSLLSAVFYRPLPFADPAELAVIVQRFAPSGNTQVYISPPNFIDWTADTTVFSGAALVADAAANLSAGDEPEHVEGERISPNTVDLLGVRPALGRSFLADEAIDGRSDVVILSDMLWRRRFAADPRVVGQTLLMDGTLHTVVGVMPPGFAFPFQAKFWVPFVIDPTADRSSNWPSAVVRLHAGVRLARANAHLATVSRRLAQQYPLSNRGVSARLASLRRLLIGGEDPDELRTTFTIMLGAVGLVLLIVCANLANLLLTRATIRGREIAIRTALGASRRRLVRQLLAESGLLAVGGGALGVLVATWVVALFHLAVAANREIPYWIAFAVDWRALLFTAGLSPATGLVIGAAPALRATRPELSSSLQEGARAAGSGARVTRLRSALVISEVGLAMVLLVGAGLLIRTVVGLARVDPGFDAAHAFTAHVALTGPRYATVRGRGAFYNELTRRLEALPGVSAVGAINLIPLTGINYEGVAVEGRDAASETALVSAVEGHYTRALGIALRAGREITEAVGERGGRVVIIHEREARAYWPRESPQRRRSRL